MSGTGEISDDYVAGILRRDAEQRGQDRYLTTGLGSLLGGRRRPRSDAPKPNTRFLKHIVKEADSHNAALKAKEEEESRKRKRMEELKRDGERGVGRGRRQADQLLSHLGKPAISRREELRTEGRSRKERPCRRRSRSPARSRSPHKRSKRQRTSVSPFDTGVGKLQKEVDQFDKYMEIVRPKSYRNRFGSDSPESVIGPQPAPTIKARGRGARSNSSMDARFDAKYDPSLDVGLPLDDEGDDWDMALEALRDRAKWKKTGAERLRAAGFTDEEVRRWEGGGGKLGKHEASEKDVNDVKWGKKGESREWDRGKVVDGDHVELKPEWGRLKDT